MRVIKKIVFVILFFMVGVTAHAETKSIQWQHYSSQAFAQAKKEHRLVLIYGKAEWCHWCQKMSATTWIDPVIVQLVVGHYIPVKVDIDSDEELARRYSINATPTIVILDANDKVIKYLPGYSTAQEMANELSSAADK